MTNRKSGTAAEEFRSFSGAELRVVGEEGIIEGYVAVWNMVDDYKSMFQRGCFAKTLAERWSRVKVLWNHGDDVIGKPLELREDDHGLFFRGQLVLGVEKAREAFELIKATAIDTFSFGFSTVRDKWVDGVRVITEVKLFEVSPVIFEANPAAQITGVRGMSTEKRDQAYQATYAAMELGRRGDLIMSALYRTLEDCWYSNLTGDDLRAKVAAATTEFGAMYLAFVDEMISNERRATRDGTFTHELRLHMQAAAQTPEAFAAATAFTLDEVRAMLEGRLMLPASKIGFLPEATRAAYIKARTERAEALFTELRAGFGAAEMDRLRGLLPPPEVPHASAIESLVQSVADFRRGLTTPTT